MSDDELVPVEGALMVGPDGETYFIPSGDLESYKIPEHEAGPARESLAPAAQARVLPSGVKVFTTVFGQVGHVPQMGPTTIPGFIDFGQREQ